MSYCTDCIHYKVCGNEGVDDSAMTFCADKKTSGDLISRTDLLNAIWQKEYGKDYDGVNLLNIKHIDIIEQMPSADNTAEWAKNGSYYQCSNCLEWAIENDENCQIRSKYCPNCGRRMLGEQTE